MKHLFGPVPSRRLGLSLGVDLVRPKTCSFDCIYCQLGSTDNKTVKRKEYVPKDEILAEIKEAFKEGIEPDYITLSGSGEPTLNKFSGEIIEGIGSITDTPTAVLTNSSLLFRKTVRDEVNKADLVVPSLDAVSQPCFEKVNRPHPSLKAEDIVDGLCRFAGSYQGEMWLEVMVVRGFNDTDQEIALISEAISRIEPDKVQLNTVVRPPSEDFAKPIGVDELKSICKRLGAEMIPEFSGKGKGYRTGIEDRVKDLLSRRPCTVDDICSPLGLHPNEVLKYLGRLEREGKLKTKRSGGKKYYLMEC